ncbi:glycosyltransferase family 4 protein [Anditalea andensis]|nr:glycosyltransferase family 4 protein [Anditalea andensis]
MENLFFPILAGIQQSGLACYVLQFSWADGEEVLRLKALAKDYGINYSHIEVYRRPIVSIGTVNTLMKGIRFLKHYLEENKIDIIMPRSTMPAAMVNFNYEFIKKQRIKIVFDADGMPLEERVDFGGVNEKGFQYRCLKSQESKLLHRADRVLTRTFKAINIHVGTIGEVYRTKFFKVTNGKDPWQFRFDIKARQKIRAKLDLGNEDTLFVYSGGLGPQYGWEEMVEIFNAYKQINSGAEWIVLTPDGGYVKNRIPINLKSSIHIINLDYNEVPEYLSAADVAFNLRRPAYSLRGLSPIKLGEYLLMGLPTISSTGIGDTALLLKEFSGYIHPYKHKKGSSLSKALHWLTKLKLLDRTNIRELALSHFSIQKSILDYRNALKF